MRAAPLVCFAAGLLTAGSAVVLPFPADARTAQTAATGAQHSSAVKKCLLTAASLEGSSWVGQLDASGSKRLELLFPTDPPHRIGVEEGVNGQAGGASRYFTGTGSYTAYDGGLDEVTFTATGVFNFQGGNGQQWAYTVRYTISSPTCEENDGRTKVKQFQVRSLDVNPATVYTMKRS